MAGLREFASHGAVFYQGAGWPQCKPLGIPDTYLPVKRSSWLIKQTLRFTPYSVIA